MGRDFFNLRQESLPKGHYELLYDGKGKDGRRFVMGLLDVDRWRVTPDTTPTVGGEKAGFGVAAGAHPGVIQPASRTPLDGQNSKPVLTMPSFAEVPAEIAFSPERHFLASYPGNGHTHSLPVAVPEGGDR